MTKRSVTKKPKLTKWFGGSVKPVRDGVYQRHYDLDTREPKILYCKFENGVWWINRKTLEGALNVSMESPFQDSIPWRGLAQNTEV